MIDALIVLGAFLAACFIGVLIDVLDRRAS